MSPVVKLRRLAALAVALSALAGCSSVSGAGSSDTRYVAGDGSTILLAPGERSTAPAITGTTLDGKPWSLAEMKGNIVVLNVWASWCAPCRGEAADLETVYEEYAPKGVAFVGLNTRDSVANASAFTRKLGVGYPSVRDEDGQIQLAFRETLPPQAIPSTLVIDRQGRIAARALGPVDKSRLRGLLDPLLDQGSS